jgi:hypothetical protein
MPSPYTPAHFPLPTLSGIRSDVLERVLTWLTLLLPTTT